MPIRFKDIYENSDIIEKYPKIQDNYPGQAAVVSNLQPRQFIASANMGVNGVPLGSATNLAGRVQSQQAPQLAMTGPAAQFNQTLTPAQAEFRRERGLQSTVPLQPGPAGAEDQRLAGIAALRAPQSPFGAKGAEAFSGAERRTMQAEADQQAAQEQSIVASKQEIATINFSGKNPTLIDVATGAATKDPNPQYYLRNPTKQTVEIDSGTKDADGNAIKVAIPVQSWLANEQMKTRSEEARLQSQSNGTAPFVTNRDGSIAMKDGKPVDNPAFIARGDRAIEVYKIKTAEDLKAAKIKADDALEAALIKGATAQAERANKVVEDLKVLDMKFAADTALKQQKQGERGRVASPYKGAIVDAEAKARTARVQASGDLNNDGVFNERDFSEAKATADAYAKMLLMPEYSAEAKEAFKAEIAIYDFVISRWQKTQKQGQ